MTSSRGASPGLTALLEPRGIAVVGASDRGWPLIIKQNLDRFEYPHPVYPVNPRRDEVWGVRCYPTISSLPTVPSLVILIVPADAALEVLEEAGGLGVGAANIFSAGFGEGGDAEGLARAGRLRAIAQRTGIRVCGPNCMGNIGGPARAVTVANAYMQSVDTGPVALVGQSGGLLMAAHRALDDRAIGVGFLVMSGGELDLTLADYIRYFAEDDDTRVIGVFLESVHDSVGFLAACDLARERGKPIVAIKVGASERGREAALAHTGALAGSTAVFEAVTRDHGVVCVPSFDDMLETLELFLHCRPEPRGGRAGVICASGGLKSLVLDLAERNAVDLPELAPATVAALAEQIGLGASAGNPLDHGAAGVGATESYVRCIELMMADDNVDVLLLQGELPRTPLVRNRNFEEINELAPTLPKPLAYFSIVSHSVTDHGREYRQQLPNYAMLQGADKALRATRAVGDYFIRKTRIESRAGADVSRDRAPSGAPGESISAKKDLRDNRDNRDDLHPKGVSALRTAGGGNPRPYEFSSAGGILDEPSARGLLASYGLAAPRDAVAATADEAIAAADAIGYPVVLKVIADGVTHKTEVGGVKLGVRSASDVRAAFDEIRRALAERAPGSQFRGVLVSEQVTPGLEVILGLQRDPDMGPVLMLGPGGTVVEWVRKVAFRAVPIDPAEIDELFEDAAIAPFLNGFRGGPPLDREALAGAIVGLSGLAVDAGGTIQTIEVNPLAVLPRGQGVRVLDALVVTRQ
ncbi:MAG: acetyl-CoA synthetase [Chloroflexi bacterium]|nr:acetyl-CoA synthetase [Chloroflexota bacterium]